MTTPTNNPQPGPSPQHIQAPEHVSTVVSIPGVGRRLSAKMIDFIAVGFTIVGFSSLTHSYLGGLLVGYGWLALSDWFGSLGKSILGLEVRNYVTGAECSIYSSTMRNLPIIVSALPVRLHQALLGIDRQQYMQTHALSMFVASCIGLAILAVVLTELIRKPGRRHVGDRFAGTIVIVRKRLGVTVSRPLR